MTQFKNLQTITGKSIHLQIPDSESKIINASHLLCLPGLIDPHVHFRTPGLEYKEDWKTASAASIHGGYTHVFDMPNTLPPTITIDALREKKALIDHQLKEANIPLRYQLFLGADRQHLNEIKKINASGLPIAGIKVFMGCSTGGMLIDQQEDLATIFQYAAEQDIVVAVHAELESQLHKNKQQYPLPQPYAMHSTIRSAEAAIESVKLIIKYARRYGTRVYIVHVSTQAEIELIAQAKSEGLSIFAEVAPHHLFLNQEDYPSLKGKAIMNPPLRTLSDQKALWEAIREGIIDTVGSDHAPHTPQEKEQPYGQCPAGVPGIETTLPLLLEAYHQGLLSLNKLVALTSENAKRIFKLPDYADYTLVDLAMRYTVQSDKLYTKCQWSPFEGRTLKGSAAYVILKETVYTLNKGK